VVFSENVLDVHKVFNLAYKSKCLTYVYKVFVRLPETILIKWFPKA